MSTPGLRPSHVFAYNHLHLLPSGTPFFTQMLQLINSATKVVHLQYYIFYLDQTGQQVLQALQQAAKRGVKVFVVVDAYASPNLAVSEFKNHGIHLKRFSPVKIKKLAVGRRMHHKICWVDGQTALIGGINIADHYSGFNGQMP
jgi:cardiolipin synthase A/B